MAARAEVEGRRLAYQPQLDGLRALAVGAVVLLHAGFGWAQGGNIGVDVFFVLSGFLITTLSLREMAGTGTLGLRAFWVRRARRLLPSLVVVGVLVLVLYGLDSGADARTETLVGVPTAWAYVTAWAEAFGWWSSGFMDHTWSLSVEETFYLLFPLAMVWAARRFSPRWIYVAAAVGVAYYLVAADVLRWSAARIYNAPDTRAQQLLIGCALAVLLERSARLRSWRGPLGHVLAVAAAVVLAGWAVSVSLYDEVYIRGGMLLVALCAAVIVWYLMTAPASGPVRLLASAPLVWAGRRSYTIYLVQYPLFGLVALESRWARLVVVVGVTLVYAAASWRWLEVRFLRRRAVAPNPGGALGATG